MLELLRTLFRYNSRSTTRLLDAIERLTPAEYVAPGCRAHGSIRDTLAHLLAVEWGWISELDGSMTPAEAEGLTLKGKEISSVAEARRRWVEIDAQTTRCLAGLSEEALLAEWTSHVPAGPTFTRPYWQFLLHVANHGPTRGRRSSPRSAVPATRPGATSSSASPPARAPPGDPEIFEKE